MFRALVPKYNHRIGTILLKFSIVKILYFWSIYIKFGRYYNDCELKIFPVACAKMRNINDNAVQGRLSENNLTRKIIA